MELNQFRDVDVVLDKANDNIIQKQFVSAGDKDGRSLTVQLTDNGVIGEIIGAALNLYWHNQASGLTDLSAFYVVDKATSVFKIDYPQNMLTPGKVIAYIQILHGGKVTHTKPFEITVQKLAGTTRGVLATAEYGALVTTLAKANEFETEIAGLDNGKMDKNTNNISVSQINKNLGKFDQTFMTDEFLQQMAGNTPINTVPADKSITQIKVADKAVATTNTDFFTGGKNLFNKYAVTKGQRIDGNTGTLLAVQGVNSSELIDVLPSTSYYRSHTDSYAIYDINGVRISGGDSASANKVISIPSNGAKVRLSVKDVNLDTFQFEKGAIQTAFEPYFNVLSDAYKIKKQSLPTLDLNMTSFYEVAPKGKNLFNPNDKDIFTGILNGDGTKNTTLIAYKTTGYIRCESGDNIIASRLSGDYMIIRAYEFYDADKNFLTGESPSSVNLPSIISVPVNARFLRVSYVANSVNYQLEKGTIATTYEAFIPNEKISKEILPELETEHNLYKNKILVTNGDSITFGTTGELPFEGGNYDNQVPWPQFVAQTLKLSLSNHAIGGSTIAVKESSPTERFPIVTRYQDMADGDVIIIAGGSNDWQYTWTPLGDMTSRTNYTFYGALHNLCLGLLEKYKGKQIVFTTPIKRAQTAQEAINTNGKTLSEYGEIIKEVCGYYGIPVIDMYNECTINPHIDTQRSEFIPDTVHPNRVGHEVMSKRIAGYIKQLA